MRSVTVELCGETLQLPVTFEAGEALAKAGFDPLEAALGKPVRTAGAVISILHIGAGQAKSKLSRKQIGEFVVEAGVINWLKPVNEYLAEFLNAGPEHPVSSDQGNEGG